MDRVRKVDINNLPEEQLKEIEAKLTAKLREIIDDSVAKANRLLNIYGMEAVMGFELRKIDENINLDLDKTNT